MVKNRIKMLVLIVGLALGSNAYADGKNPGAAGLVQQQQQQQNNSSNIVQPFVNTSNVYKSSEKIQIPTGSSATAGARAQVDPCPIITEVSDGKTYFGGVYSKSEVGMAPARTNGICVMYHIAKATNNPEDWQKVSDYACQTDAVYAGIACKAE